MNNDVRARIDLTEAITVQVRFADGGSPAPQPAPVSIYSDFAAVHSNALTGTATDYWSEHPDYQHYAGSEEIGTSQSISVQTNVHYGAAYILAACMHRDTVSISGSGWTKIIESAHATVDSVEQRVTVWGKMVTPGYSETVTFTQGSSIRMQPRMFAFYCSSASVSVAGDDLIASFNYDPPAKTGKCRLYLPSSIIASGSNQAIVLVNEPSDSPIIQFTGTRFPVFLDLTTESNYVPQFDSGFTGYVANSAQCLTLDIVLA